MLPLKQILEKAKACFQKESIEFALIGGFAMGAHGFHRATQDIDLLIDGSRRQDAINALIGEGFKLVFQSPEVLQFEGTGYLDLLLANRPLSLEMLRSATASSIEGVRLVSAEGIIGLKIQAYTNDSSRRLRDLADIKDLLGLESINLELVKKYADLFEEWPTISGIRSSHVSD